MVQVVVFLEPQLTVQSILFKTRSKVKLWLDTPVTEVLNYSDLQEGSAKIMEHGFHKASHFVVRNVFLYFLIKGMFKLTQTILVVENYQFACQPF